VSRTSTTLLGAARYEFAMQVRRPWVWVIVGGLALGGLLSGDVNDHAISLVQAVGDSAMYVNAFVLVVVGLLLSDRIIRDRRLRAEDLLISLPSSERARLWGKFLGVVAAMALPLAAGWTLDALRIALVRHDLVALPLAAGAFATIMMPGLLVVAAAALTLPVWLGAPLFRVLFVGYWVWGNLIFGGPVPSPAETWFTPVGSYAGSGLFHARFAPLHPPASSALASIAVLLACGATVLIAFTTIEERRRRAA